MAKLKINTTKTNANKKIESAKNFMLEDEKMQLVHDFIDKFILCELACKHIVEAYKKYRKTYNPKAFITLHMNSIVAAFELYEYPIRKHELSGVFGAAGIYKKNGTRSPKVLRDCVMHTFKSSAIDEIVERSEELDELMTRFLEYFE